MKKENMEIKYGIENPEVLNAPPVDDTLDETNRKLEGETPPVDDTLDETNRKLEGETPPVGDTEVDSEVDTIPVEVVSAVVVNCRKLNVRKKPNMTAEVACVLDVGELLTLKNVSPEGWARVYTDTDIKGYVRNEFIKEC